MRNKNVWVLGIAFWALGCAGSLAQSVVVTQLHAIPAVPSINAADAYSLFMGKVDHALYGVTYSDNTNGTIFTLNTDGSGYAVLHTFAFGDRGVAQGNILQPGLGFVQPSLIQGSDGALYGTTVGGILSAGNTNYPTVFKLLANGTGYTAIHTFSDLVDTPSSLMQANDGSFYGGADALIFKIDSNGGNFTVLKNFDSDTEGSDILGTLLQASDGLFYGAAFLGGTNQYGTIFSLTTNSVFRLLHTFTGGDDGAHPMAGLMQGSDGALYGSTMDFGTNGPSPGGAGGTLFKIDTDGNNYRVLHRFSNLGNSPNDGCGPMSTLVESSGGILYGTTYAGGNSSGTIFRIGLDGNGYASLYFFTNLTVGKSPVAGLSKGQTQGDIGVFYGLNSHGVPGIADIFAVLVNPPLFITPVVGQAASNQTALFWPAWAAKYTLQSTTNVASSNWVNVTDSVPVFGAQVTSTNPAMFYRLVSP